MFKFCYFASLRARARALAAVLGLAGVVLLVQAGVAGAAPAAGPGLDWPQYLHGPQHSSVSPATAFTPSNAASASEVWHWQPPVIQHKSAPALETSPTVVAGRVYIGAESGGFYALNESTGAVEWHRQLDTCPRRGITATAAVEPDPVTGVSTVYVSGSHFLYALDAVTGAQVWKTRIGPNAGPRMYYNWSSPMVVAGHILRWPGVGLRRAADPRRGGGTRPAHRQGAAHLVLGSRRV